MHAEKRRPPDATELKNDGMIKVGDIRYQTEQNLSLSFFFESSVHCFFFSESDLINNDSILCSQIHNNWPAA